MSRTNASGGKDKRVRLQGQQCADEPEGTIHAHCDVSLVKTVKVTTPGGTAAPIVTQSNPVTVQPSFK